VGLRGEVRASPKATQLLATAFGGGERCLGAIGDKAGLELSHESHMLRHEAASRALNLRQSSTQSKLASPRKQGRRRALHESSANFSRRWEQANPALTTIAVGAWHLFGASRSTTIIATGEGVEGP